MKILLAADGSEYTKRAARHLAKHLAWFSTPPEVVVLYVHPLLPYPGAAAAAGRKAVEKYEREESEKCLKVARRELDKAGVAYAAKWVCGDVATEVGRFVKKNGVDMVVMGSHGHGAFLNLALGSTAAKLIATLTVPVMVVR